MGPLTTSDLIDLFAAVATTLIAIVSVVIALTALLLPLVLARVNRPTLSVDVLENCPRHVNVARGLEAHMIYAKVSVKRGPVEGTPVSLWVRRAVVREAGKAPLVIEEAAPFPVQWAYAKAGAPPPYATPRHPAIFDLAHNLNAIGTLFLRHFIYKPTSMPDRVHRPATVELLLMARSPLAKDSPEIIIAIDWKETRTNDDRIETLFPVARVIGSR